MPFQYSSALALAFRFTMCNISGPSIIMCYALSPSSLLLLFNVKECYSFTCIVIVQLSFVCMNAMKDVHSVTYLAGAHVRERHDSVIHF